MIILIIIIKVLMVIALLVIRVAIPTGIPARIDSPYTVSRRPAFSTIGSADWPPYFSNHLLAIGEVTYTGGCSLKRALHNL